MADKVIGVHNGFISNDEQLFSNLYDKVERSGRVDSEIIFRLINYYTCEHKDTLFDAVIRASKMMSGSFACTFIHTDWPDYLTLFTNSAPISIFIFEKMKIMVFASTTAITRSSMQVQSVLGNANEAEIIEIKRGGARINLKNGKIFKFKIDSTNQSYAGMGYDMY